MGYQIIAYDKPTDKQGFIVFDPSIGRSINAGTLSLKYSDISDLSLTVNQLNPLFDRVKPMQTHIEVYEDGKLVFRGRALKPTREMESSGGFIREFSFEDIEAYLLDSIQRFNDDGGSDVKTYIQNLLKVHNAQVDSYKQFTLRNCDYATGEGITRRQIDYPNTRQAIQDQLIKITGGHLNVVYDPVKRVNYLDFTKNFGTVHTNDTPISITKNMLSAKQVIDVSGVITKLIPLGKTKPNPEIQLGDDNTSTSVSTDGINGATHAVNGDWGPAIRNAAKIMGVTVSDSQVAAIKNMIQGESGGSETVVNNWDSNARAGHPSAGLLQFIEQTFKKYAVKPFTTWKRGFDQLCALFNMDDWASQVAMWQRVRAWSPNGNRRLSEVKTTQTQTFNSNKWGWPFPDVGEGHFSGAQLFGIQPGGEFRTNGFHDGLDFGSVDHPGSAIHAIHGGTVVKIGYDGYIGWYVLTHSQDGYDIIYQEAFSSRSKIAVSQGQTVKTGDIIGYRDTSHVHIGVTKKSWYDGYNGHSFDPHWAWLDPQQLIKNGGQQGDKTSNITTYKDESPQGRFDITSVNNGKDYLISDALVKEFGIIEGIQEFDEVEDPAQIKQLGENWLKDEEKHVSKNSYEVSAIELPNFERFKVGDSYPFINKLVESNNLTLKIIEKDIDFTKDRNSSLKIADVVKTLADYQVEDQRNINKRFRQLQSDLQAQQRSIANLSTSTSDLDGSIKNSHDSTAEQGVFNSKLLKEDLDEFKNNFNKWKADELPKQYASKTEIESLEKRIEILEQKGADSSDNV